MVKKSENLNQRVIGDSEAEIAVDGVKWTASILEWV